MWMGWPHVSSSTGKWTKTRARRKKTSRGRGAEKAPGLRNTLFTLNIIQCRKASMPTLLDQTVLECRLHCAFQCLSEMSSTQKTKLTKTIAMLPPRNFWENIPNKSYYSFTVCQLPTGIQASNKQPSQVFVLGELLDGTIQLWPKPLISHLCL